MSEKKTIDEYEARRQSWLVAVEDAPEKAKAMLLNRLKEIKFGDVSEARIRADNFVVESTGPNSFVVYCPDMRCGARWTFNLRKLAEQEVIGPLNARSNIPGPDEVSMNDSWRTLAWGLVRPIAHMRHPVAGGLGAGGPFELHLRISDKVVDEVLALFTAYWEARKAADKKLKAPDTDPDGMLETFTGGYEEADGVR